MQWTQTGIVCKGLGWGFGGMCVQEEGQPRLLSY